MSIKKLILLLIVGVWLGVLIVAITFKLDADGFLPCVSHLTNWNWILQLLFFFSEFYALTVSCDSHRVVNVSVFFWIVNGVTWLVFWLVFLMIRDNPNVILGLIDTNGGPYPAWVVLNGNAVFHVLIVIALLFYAFFSWNLIADSLLFLAHKRLVNAWIIIPYVILLPLLIVGAYLALFDVSIIYGLTTSVVALIFISLGILLVFNGLPAFLILYYRKRFKTSIVRGMWKERKVY